MFEEETTAIDPEILSSLSTIAERSPVLTVLGGQLAGQQCRLVANELILGRAHDCGMVLPDVGVSRQHAKLVRTAEGYVLQDLGSTNGTFVSGTRVTSVLLKDDDKIVIGPDAILVFHLTEPIESNVHLTVYTNSTCDALTGLFNRRLFSELIKAEWAYSERQGQDLSVIMIDIDKFKGVNDTFGHPAGDAILRGFAETLKQTVRLEDIPARIGGEEFVVLLRHTPIQQANILAERLREAVQATLYPVPMPQPDGTTGAGNLRITISSGLASRGHTQVASPDELLSLCDQALYQSKQNGRNRVTLSPGPAP